MINQSIPERIEQYKIILCEYTAEITRLKRLLSQNKHIDELKQFEQPIKDKEDLFRQLKSELSQLEEEYGSTKK